MIKDINNAIVLNLTINATDAQNARAGDIIVYDFTTKEWVLCKAGLIKTNTIFAVIVDDRNGETDRLCAVSGIVETNIEGDYEINTPLFFYSEKNAMSSAKPNLRIENGYIVKRLPNVSGVRRALVKINNNVNTIITTP